jgi:predicted nucleic-acid-binding protein
MPRFLARRHRKVEALPNSKKVFGATRENGMRAIDTNVLIRLITRDDAKQVASAEAFIAKGAWVSTLALAETVWVLDSVFGLSPVEQASAIEMLLNHQDLVLQDPEIVSNALGLFRAKPALGFSDCLLLKIATKAGHLPLGTFDRGLARVEGTQKLQP